MLHSLDTDQFHSVSNGKQKNVTNNTKKQDRQIGLTNRTYDFALRIGLHFPSVLRHCWLGDRKRIVGCVFADGDYLTGALHVI